MCRYTSHHKIWIQKVSNYYRREKVFTTHNHANLQVVRLNASKKKEEKIKCMFRFIISHEKFFFYIVWYSINLHRKHIKSEKYCTLLQK